MQTKQNGITWLFNLYAVLFLLLPWSPDIALGTWHIRLPSEGLSLLLGMCLLIVIRSRPELLQVFRNRQFLLLSAIAWLIWLTITMLFSTMQLVSFKYWLVESGQYWVFFVGFLLFPGWWQRLLPLFAYSMGGAVLYTLAHHFQYQFRADQSMLSPLPFFPDHTLYSAILVMLLPTLPILFRKNIAAGLAVLFLIGLFVANCRAAWLSLAVCMCLLLPFIFRLKWQWGFVPVGLLFLGALLMQEPILEKLSKDVSSSERLNRYACALRMSEQRPFTGFGPGTFQFQYLPFQKASEMTRISIVNPEQDLKPDQFGRGGGAHSEYFQALAENGWPGLLIWMLLSGSAIFTGLKIFYKRQNKDNQWFILAVTASLLTYFLHALFNNFLHDGRIAMLFWGQLAWLIRSSNTRE